MLLDETQKEKHAHGFGKKMLEELADKGCKAVIYVEYVEPETVQAGIISTHEINKNNPNYIFRVNILGDSDLLKHKTDLSKHLDKLFLKIFDDKTPFLQTEDTKRCKNCEFLHLCGRQTVTGSY